MSRVVLVVDDDPAVLELVAEMLTELRSNYPTGQYGGFGRARTRSTYRIIADRYQHGRALQATNLQNKRLRPGLQPILISAQDMVGRGFPLLRKPFLQSELARVITETTGL